jgi:SpoVK/Ycf46/Vps4 family AAA+-type ATPase
MVNSKDIIEIYKKIANKDNKGFIDVTLQIIKKEQDMNHFQTSNSLIQLIERIQDNESLESEWIEEFSEIPIDRDRTVELIQVKWPKFRLNEILLSAESEEIIQRILTEWRTRTSLAQYGLKPKRRILFFGPPGCGKTYCASVLAGELQIPLLVVKTDSLVSSLLGETSINLRKIFDSLNNKRQCVLLFDEFDSIGKSRIDQQEHGELRRAVSSLLQFIESSPPNVLLVAATNHPKLLDLAVWRRFDDIIEFPYPNENQIKELIQLKMKNFKFELNDYSEIILKLDNTSHADIERVCQNSIKNVILKKKKVVLLKDILDETEILLSRLQKIQKIKNQ